MSGVACGRAKFIEKYPHNSDSRGLMFVGFAGELPHAATTSMGKRLIRRQSECRSITTAIPSRRQRIDLRRAARPQAQPRLQV